MKALRRIAESVAAVAIVCGSLAGLAIALVALPTVAPHRLSIEVAYPSQPLLADPVTP